MMLGSRGYRPLAGYSPPAKKLLSLAVISSFIILFLFFIPLQPSSTFQEETIQYIQSPQTDPDSCTPHAYAQGSWSYHPRTTAENMTSPDDALAFSGFEKCASSREYYWHLASDRLDHWDRFPAAQSWEWIPGKECKGMNPFTPEDLVKNLVEDGGWYLVGGKYVQ